ncbi:MAG: uridine diphosphate-N-acetylglucosamine-binding protein YvcK [Chloroflexota bacterium]|nr:MAG: uridine diphosphate-N-acetylglucosamine-binding protein YvcK [Chloroflexota bacterium]
MNGKYSLRVLWRAWRGWFAVGIGVKRWLIVLAVGAVIAGTGIGSLLLVMGQRHVLPDALYSALTLQFLPTGLRILVPLLVGTAIIFLAIVRLGNNLLAPFLQPGDDVALALQSYTQRSRGPRIVAIGGGTGMPSLLRGLSHYTSNITAVVTVADDGGSSGRLRRELGVLPPGDFRNNIAALARDEALMTQVLQYRFGGSIAGDGDDIRKSELQGHAFGNLLLAALVGVTGSFDEALDAAGRVLAVRGRVLPSTLANVTLAAEIADQEGGSARRVEGESAITSAGGRIRRVMLEPADAPAYPPAVQAVLQADLVVVGPGSLYTSILPNLLLPDIAQALRHTGAKRVYACNLATQPGETDNYTVADHVKAIQRHVVVDGHRGRKCLDVVIANDNLSIPPGTGGGETVFVSPDGPDDIPVVPADLVDRERPWRHDSAKLARVILGLTR